MKYLSKYLAVTLVITIIVSFGLQGCGRKSESNDGVVRLSVWVSYNNEEMPIFNELTKKFVAKWNSEHDQQIAIKPSQVPFGGLLPKLKTACQTHTTPDICRVDCAHVVPLAFGQALVPLDTLKPFKDKFRSIEQLRSLFVEAAIDSNIINVRREGKWVEHLFGLPDRTNCVCLFRNRSMFREKASELRAVGLSPDRAPKTWDEMIEYGKVLADKGEYAFAMDNSLWWSLPFFNSWGADFLNIEKGHFTCVLDREEAIEALQFKADLYQKKYDFGGRKVQVEAGAWRPGAISKDTGFINGMYAMIMTGPWNVKTFRDAGLDFDVNLVPAGPAGSSSNVGGSNLVVFKSCKHPEIAYEYIKFVTNAESQTQWCNALSQIPTILAAFKTVSTEGKPALAAFFDQIVKAKARPRVPNYDQLEEIINPEMALALKGNKTPKQALSDAVKRINKEVLAQINKAK